MFTSVYMEADRYRSPKNTRDINAREYRRIADLESEIPRVDPGERIQVRIGTRRHGGGHWAHLR